MSGAGVCTAVAVPRHELSCCSVDAELWCLSPSVQPLATQSCTILAPTAPLSLLQPSDSRSKPFLTDPPCDQGI